MPTDPTAEERAAAERTRLTLTEQMTVKDHGALDRAEEAERRRQAKVIVELRAAAQAAREERDQEWCDDLGLKSYEPGSEARSHVRAQAFDEAAKVACTFDPVGLGSPDAILAGVRAAILALKEEGS